MSIASRIGKSTICVVCGEDDEIAGYCYCHKTFCERNNCFHEHTFTCRRWYARLTRHYNWWRRLCRTKTVDRIANWCRDSRWAFIRRAGFCFFDVLNNSGFYGHLRSMLWNWWHIDVWWAFCHWIDDTLHPAKARARQKFFKALWQVNSEDLMDPLPDLSQSDDPVTRELGKVPMIGGVMGKRYFERLGELLKEDRENQE